MDKNLIKNLINTINEIVTQTKNPIVLEKQADPKITITDPFLMTPDEKAAAMAAAGDDSSKASVKRTPLWPTAAARARLAAKSREVSPEVSPGDLNGNLSMGRLTDEERAVSAARSALKKGPPIRFRRVLDWEDNPHRDFDMDAYMEELQMQQDRRAGRIK